MTTATTDTQQRISALEQEKADYNAELSRTLARLDVLRREVRESGPGNTTAAVKVRGLEADETKLRGTLAQVEQDHAAALVSLRNEERAAADEVDISTIRHAQQVEVKAARVEADWRAAIAAVDPHALALVQVQEEQKAARVAARSALRALAMRHGLIAPDSLPGYEENAVMERFAHSCNASSLLEQVMRPSVPLLSLPVIQLQWPESPLQPEEVK